MILRGLLCGALLLASPSLLLAEQAAAPPDTQSDPQLKTQSDDAVGQADAGLPPPEGTPDQPARLDCAPAPQAHTLIGKYGCVSGRVSRIVYTRKGNVRLYLCPKDQCPFHATVYADDVEKVGNLLSLRGRLVAIDGDVRLYHGVPEIKVSDRDQISVTAGGSHETDTASPGSVKEKRKREVPTEKAW